MIIYFRYSLPPNNIYSSGTDYSNVIYFKNIGIELENIFLTKVILHDIERPKTTITRNFEEIF